MSVVPLVEKADSKSAKVAARIEDIVGDGFDVRKFVDNFDVLVEASKGVKNLRSLVLKLGLVGKLGTNEPSEPFSAVRLVREPNASVAAPHRNWIVCHLPDVADIEMGNSPPGTSYNEHGAGVPLINGPVEFSPGPFGLTRRTKFTTAPARMCNRGDLLVCVRGATTGRTNIADFDACIGRGVALVRAHKNQGYLNYYMWSVGNDLLAAGTGTTFPAISRDDLVALVVLLPPLAEQKRIVAKVDDLMRLLDDLEAKQTKKRDVQIRLRTAALNALTSATGPEEFAVAWKRMAENFAVLFDTSADVVALRKVVLEAAMRGALCDPSTSTRGASVDELLRAAARRVRDHYATRRSSRRSAIEPVRENEYPKLPGHWRAARWGEIGVCQNGTAFPSEDYCHDGIKLLRPGNLHVSGRVAWTDENTRYLPRRYEGQAADFIVGPGELVMNLTAQSLKDEFLGRVCLTGPNEHCLLNQRIARLTPFAITAPFAMWFLRCPFFRRYVDGLNQGTLIQHMFTSQVDAAIVFVPPLDEQERIVAKVEHLMKVCDDLEAKLQRVEDTAAKLVEAAVSEMVA